MKNRKWLYFYSGLLLCLLFSGCALKDNNTAGSQDTPNNIDADYTKSNTDDLSLGENTDPVIVEETSSLENSNASNSENEYYDFNFEFSNDTLQYSGVVTIPSDVGDIYDISYEKGYLYVTNNTGSRYFITCEILFDKIHPTITIEDVANKFLEYDKISLMEIFTDEGPGGTAATVDDEPMALNKINDNCYYTEFPIAYVVNSEASGNTTGKARFYFESNGKENEEKRYRVLAFYYGENETVYLQDVCDKVINSISLTDFSSE